MARLDVCCDESEEGNETVAITQQQTLPVVLAAGSQVRCPSPSQTQCQWRTLVVAGVENWLPRRMLWLGKSEGGGVEDEGPSAGMGRLGEVDVMDAQAQARRVGWARVDARCLEPELDLPVCLCLCLCRWSGWSGWDCPPWHGARQRRPTRALRVLTVTRWR